MIFFVKITPREERNEINERINDQDLIFIHSLFFFARLFATNHEIYARSLQDKCLVTSVSWQ